MYNVFWFGISLYNTVDLYKISLCENAMSLYYSDGVIP